jgi:chromosome segregation ATPase
VTTLALLLALLVGALLVGAGSFGAAWWHRRAEVRELEARAGALEETNAAIEQRNADLSADLDQVRAGWADLRAQRDALEADLARERRRRRADDQCITAWQDATADVELSRRSLERERERWSDLINPAGSGHRADRLTPAEAETLADLERRLEES